MPKIFLLEDGEIEEDIKFVIEETARINKINNLEVILPKIPVSLENIPMCDAYIFNLGLVDELQHFTKIKKQNPSAKIYGTGVINEEYQKMLDQYYFLIHENEAESILKDIKSQNKKAGE